MAIRQGVLNLYEKEVCNFHEFHTPDVLAGLSCVVEKKNCKINFQCSCKNVIMVIYGKSDCGPCPYSHGPRSASGELIENLVKVSLDWRPLLYIYIYIYIHVVHVKHFLVTFGGKIRECLRRGQG